MHIDDFSYELPESKIATHPPKIRGNSKLLVLSKQSGIIEHEKYNNFVNYVEPGDVVILNDTRVIKARLTACLGHKKREFLLLERHCQNLDTHHWKIMYKGKIKAGETYSIGHNNIEVEEIYGNGLAKISSKTNLLKISDQFGDIPLPPYIKRLTTNNDIMRYQTEFARSKGSVAAPTASLNFTLNLKEKLIKQHINVVYITLHVGLGTFLPIRTKSLEKHVMHSEYFEIPASTQHAIKQAKINGNKILAVGTTVTRALEYAHKDIFQMSAKNISGEANIFIYPGYKFKVIDMLLTNFHAPKSTVLMMASAFAGWNNLEKAYNTALLKDYKFLSYGDSMLII